MSSWSKFWPGECLKSVQEFPPPVQRNDPLQRRAHVRLRPRQQPAWTADHQPEQLPFAASAAKVAAAGAAWAVAASALQVHGGIGFSWEHPIHLFLRRAAASSRLLGSVDQHLERIAALSGLGVGAPQPAPREPALSAASP